MTDIDKLVAELRKRTFVAANTWPEYARSERLLKDRAADRIEALVERAENAEVEERRLREAHQEQFARAERAERERDALKAELERRLNGPIAEAYRLERDAAAERARVSAEIVKTLQAERDSYAAVIATARVFLRGDRTKPSEKYAWRTLKRTPAEVLREHDERVASAAVIGVQRWMAADLGSALGHADPTAVNDGERSWADWWARLIHEVRETPERVWDEGAEAREDNRDLPLTDVLAGSPYRRIEGSKTE